MNGCEGSPNPAAEETEAPGTCQEDDSAKYIYMHMYIIPRIFSPCLGGGGHCLAMETLCDLGIRQFSLYQLLGIWPPVTQLH